MNLIIKVIFMKKSNIPLREEGTLVCRAAAPGRVNLMGEHADDNGGLVLPMPIPQATIVEAAARVT